MGMTRPELDFVYWVGSTHGAKVSTVGTKLHPLGHPKRAAELRVVIHAMRDWCRQTPADWATWQDGIR